MFSRLAVWGILLPASASSAVMARNMPRLVAFDLDGTIWTPDMYELWGGGAPFRVISCDKLKDKAGTTVRLLGDSANILRELKYEQPDIITTWVSCTDEPSWAEECLKKFTTKEGESIGSLVNGQPQIFKANKQEHFKRLLKAYPTLVYEDIIFFDNEMGNIRSVSKLGVLAIYTPDGMTREVWNEGLRLFAQKRKS